MTDEFLESVIQDIKSRASKVLLNDSIEVSLFTVSTNGKDITIVTDTFEEDVTINNIKLMTSEGVVIVERIVNIEILKQDYVEFTFDISVRGDN